MQISGSVNQLESFIDLRDGNLRKRGPMRIEKAIAATPNAHCVTEFNEPVIIIYGRPDSDSASYGASARGDHGHCGDLLEPFFRVIYLCASRRRETQPAD